MKKKFDVAVVGNAGVDTNVYLRECEMASTVESHFTENLDCVGQAGGYAARGYAQLGRKVAFIGSLGDDSAGEMVRKAFIHDAIDISAVFKDPEGTARSVNIMGADGARKSYYDGKGHLHIQPDLSVCQSIFSQSRLAHFNIPQWARTLLPVARAEGCVIACDIQDVVCADDPYRLDFIKNTDILFFSSVNHPDPMPLMKAFWAMNSQLIMVAGQGDRGCALGVNNELTFLPPVSMSKPVLDCNGAGDSLAVGFLSAHVIEGLDIEQAVHWGQWAARWCCTQQATTDNLLSQPKLHRLINGEEID